MAQTPEGVASHELNVVARHVLLDTLEILGNHAESVTVVGAQAVYLRTQEVALAVAAYTSDADLCLDSEKLSSDPRLEVAMREAGFELRSTDHPGLWQRHEQVGDTEAPVEVDLLVPEGIAGKGRRGVTIPPHGRHAAGRVPGLEAALVDRDRLSIPSLDSADPRVAQAYVAGSAALLIAKAYKLHERVNGRDQSRLQNKDAGDVLRLIMSESGDPVDVARRVRELTDDGRTADVTEAGLRYFRSLFGTPAATGTQMAVEALAGAMDGPTVEALAPGYVSDLLAELT